MLYPPRFLNVWNEVFMEITLFDLILIIKDTEKPIILINSGKMEKYAFREIAMDNELLTLNVAGVRVDTVYGKPSYLVKVRG